jgi:hypothetical protein
MNKNIFLLTRFPGQRLARGDVDVPTMLRRVVKRLHHDKKAMNIRLWDVGFW